MTVVFAGEPAPASFAKSLFLLGPTPRSASVLSWRPAALQLLESRGYDGVVFVPEARQGTWPDYDAQMAWELASQRLSDVLLCWMPATEADLPGLTTRVECGSQATSGKLVFGAPADSYKTNYLSKLLPRYNVPVVQSLEEVVDLAVQRLGAGAQREGAHRFVPLEIWQAAHFQDWLRSQNAAGHELVDVQSVEWVFRRKEGVREQGSGVRPCGPDSCLPTPVSCGTRTFPFYIALHVSMAVAGENRVKANEAVIIRSSISTVAAWCPGASRDGDRFVLVKEYRTPVLNREGFVYELPGGSSLKPAADPVEAGLDELSKETGLRLPRDRCAIVARRQVAATIVANQCLLLSARLSADEMDRLASLEGTAHGEEAETERTYLCVRTRQQIIEEGLVDFVTLGQISLIGG